MKRNRTMKRYGKTQQDIDYRQTALDRAASYRTQVRKTMQTFSDQALRFQNSIIIGGIDREECDREMNRRGI